MAFRLVNSLRMQAVRATFAAFPAARKRSSKALSIGLSRAATRALLDSVARTGTRPPPIARLPRSVPRSRVNGATPTKAASRWRLNVPNSGRSTNSVRAQTGPLPGTRRSRAWRSRHPGLGRSVVSRSSSSAARRVSSQVIGAWRSVCSRGGALPRRSVRPCAGRPMAAAVPAAPGVRRLGRPAGPGGAAARPRQHGPKHARRAQPSWPPAPWPWQRHALGGDCPPRRAALPPPAPPPRPLGSLPWRPAPSG